MFWIFTALRVVLMFVTGIMALGGVVLAIGMLFGGGPAWGIIQVIVMAIVCGLISYALQPKDY